MSVPEILKQYTTDATQGSVPEINLYQSSPKPRLPFTPNELEDLYKPKVLIAGGGIGGLTMAILLKKAGIPFKVFERTQEIKPLGSAIALGATIAPLFTQLGIYDELLQLATRLTHVHVISENMKPVYTMDLRHIKDITTYSSLIIPRPDLYDLLWRQVPRENIVLGKRILSFQQNDHGVTIRCADKSEYDGDILVGADGAHSAVRQHLYALLRKAGKLPASDDVPLPFSSVCLVGQTEPLDPEIFPDLKDELCKDYSVIGKNMCTWCTFTTKKNTMCWMVIHFLDKESSKKNDSFRSSEWGPEAAEAMCKEVRDFKVPSGKKGTTLTMGDLIDKTPKNLISKVMLEEKVFDTWYGGRTVLLGDACHKLVPSAGQGGLSAMHDAVTLANWIVTLQAPSLSELNTIFKEYRDERYPVAKEEYLSSQGFTDILGKNFRSMIVRALLKRLPSWIWRRIITRMNLSRPQASFLQLIEDNATLKAGYQASLDKTRLILETQALEKQKASQEEATVAI